jgi:SAM-dependent methyltransferase
VVAVIKVLLGSLEGRSKPEGWKVVGPDKEADVQIDLALEPLPFLDSSVDLILASHCLQRVPAGRIPFALGEMRRVIKPGGWRASADGSRPFEGGLIRMSLPDLAAACRAYADQNEAFFLPPGAIKPESEQPLGARLVEWLTRPDPDGRGFVHAFDHESIAWWLTREGFDGMYRSAYRKSLVPELRAEGLDLRPHDSIYIEAWKSRRAA